MDDERQGVARAVKSLAPSVDRSHSIPANAFIPPSNLFFFLHFAFVYQLSFIKPAVGVRHVTRLPLTWRSFSDVPSNAAALTYVGSPRTRLVLPSVGGEPAARKAPVHFAQLPSSHQADSPAATRQNNNETSGSVRPRCSAPRLLFLLVPPSSVSAFYT